MNGKFDYSDLLERAKDYRYNVSSLAKAMPISRTSLHNKLSGEVNFQQSDIRKIVVLLDIPNDEIGKYFFYTENSETRVIVKEGTI